MNTTEKQIAAAVHAAVIAVGVDAIKRSSLCLSNARDGWPG